MQLEESWSSPSRPSALRLSLGMACDPDRDRLTPDFLTPPPAGPLARCCLQVLRALCSAGVVVCSLLVLGLSVNMAIALLTPPFGLEGVRARLAVATAELGPEDTLLGVEASAFVPFVAIAIFAVAVLGLWALPAAGGRLRARIGSGRCDGKEKPE